MVFFILNSLSFLISLLGFKGIYYLAKILSYVSFDLLKIRRSIILQNLDIVYADSKTIDEKKKIGRNSMTSFFSTLLEFLAGRKLFSKAKITFTNKHIVTEIMSRNMGIYAMCIHMSNWELLCHINSKTIAPVHVVVKPIGKGKVAKWVEDLRTEFGFYLIDRKASESATTQIFKALEQKEIIGFIVDQKRPKGEKLPFFGKIASTNTSLAKLYLKRKAPIVPVISKRIGIGEFEFIYFPEFIIIEDNTLTFEQQVIENTKRMNLCVEQMILLNPNEYFWMHNRWDLKKT